MHFILATWENSYAQIENTRLFQNILSVLNRVMGMCGCLSLRDRVSHQNKYRCLGMVIKSAAFFT